MKFHNVMVVAILVTVALGCSENAFSQCSSGYIDGFGEDGVIEMGIEYGECGLDVQANKPSGGGYTVHDIYIGYTHPNSVDFIPNINAYMTPTENSYAANPLAWAVARAVTGRVGMSMSAQLRARLFTNLAGAATAAARVAGSFTDDFLIVIGNEALYVRLTLSNYGRNVTGYTIQAHRFINVSPVTGVAGGMTELGRVTHNSQNAGILTNAIRDVLWLILNSAGQQQQDNDYDSGSDNGMF